MRETGKRGTGSGADQLFTGVFFSGFGVLFPFVVSTIVDNHTVDIVDASVNDTLAQLGVGIVGVGGWNIKAEGLAFGGDDVNIEGAAAIASLFQIADVSGKECVLNALKQGFVNGVGGVEPLHKTKQSASPKQITGLMLLGSHFQQLVDEARVFALQVKADLLEQFGNFPRR